ncbi:hypothetical protein [Psychroflexus montanilacus]|uniref:hypothetical protein n=1 Tax=Psychroflexus montanilacus TaxID=2873598 RepID=UPI001CCE25DF|nr:hypothetical protein [Psychroflexus montanilacus]MBZ9651427.1 hypothetical protein [Psychroflexus montanilacus]
MSDHLTFLNSSWFWPVLICWLILILVFVWKEWKTSGRKHLILKIFLSLLAVTSLALLALKPAVPKEIKEGRVIIITEHYNQNQLDSLKKEYRKSKVLDYRKEKALSGLTDSKEIFVLGSGVNVYDLWQLENTPVTYFPGEEVTGLIKLNYKQDPQVGKRLHVRGRFSNPKPGNRLVLEDAAGTALDSVVFDAEDHINFELSTDLKVSGNYVFSLSEKDSIGKVLNQNPLPLKVKEAKTLRILILNAYPTFEIKYLKNFLAELGHEVIVKNRITTGRFKFEFFNTERQNIGRLNSSNLDDFDLLILDSESTKALSRSEQNAVQKSMRASGLGILMLGEANALTNLGDFSVFEFQRVSATEVVLDDLDGVTVGRQPFQIKNDFGVEDIHRSNSSIVSGYQRMEQGRLGVTLLENTWELQLEGKQEAYQHIWTDIVEQLSKRNSEMLTCQPEKLFAFKDEPFTFQIRTSLDDPRVLDQNHRLLPLKQDLTLAEVWSGKTFPKESGWQKLRVEQDSTFAFDYFVHNPEDWQTVKAYQNSLENQEFFQKESVIDKDFKKSPIAINPIWFYVLFLLAIGGLWLEPKL